MTKEDVMHAELKNVGARLRSLRHSQGLSLDALAASVGMSASTLSRLESGKRQASLELLLPLTKRLGVRVDDLLNEQNSDPRVKQKAFRRSGLTIIPLAPESGPVLTYKITYPATLSEPKLQIHEGFEWFYVLKGKIRLRLGDQDLIIDSGEAAQFDTTTPHAICAAANRSAEVISIFNVTGAALHVYDSEMTETND